MEGNFKKKGFFLLVFTFLGFLFCGCGDKEDPWEQTWYSTDSPKPFHCYVAHNRVSGKHLVVLWHDKSVKPKKRRTMFIMAPLESIILRARMSLL